MSIFMTDVWIKEYFNLVGTKKISYSGKFETYVRHMFNVKRVCRKCMLFLHLLLMCHVDILKNAFKYI